MSINYRPEIDGLRALAVLSVVFFHADIPGLAGGFLGVDVFFVISGFLITSIILQESEADKFSFATFYERRVRRIIPAAVVVFAVSALFAWLTLMPAAFVKFCNSLLAASFFASNWYFLGDVGYFAAPAATKPLLHTWTLSIEEQFYLIFPLLLMFATTTTRRFLLLAALCVGSILYARWLNTVVGFDAVFYNSFARAFEPLIGCLTALAFRNFSVPRVASSALRTAGLALIACSFFWIGASTYKYLLVPCIGAAAFLMAYPDQRDPVFRIMASAPARAVGLLSYSIYLWHWPIFVFARIYLGNLEPAEKAGCILLTFLLSAGTFYFIENPIRSRKFPASRFRLFGLAAASTAMVAAFAGLGIHGAGMPGRVPQQVHVIRATSVFTPALYSCFDPPGGIDSIIATANEDRLCQIGDTTKAGIDFILWGDSHAFAVSEGFSEFARDHGLHGILAMTPGCPPLANTYNPRSENCNALYQAVAKLVERQHIPRVFLVARWSLYTVGDLYPGAQGLLEFADDRGGEKNSEVVFARSLDRTVSEIRDRRIIVLKEPPAQPMWVTETMAANAFMGRSADKLRWASKTEHLKRHSFLDKTFADLATKYPNVTILDPVPIICVGDRCSGARDDLPLYWDDDHLNVRGARLLFPLLSKVFAQSVEHSD